MANEKQKMGLNWLREWLLLITAVIYLVGGLVGTAPAWVWITLLASITSLIFGPPLVSQISGWFLSARRWRRVKGLVPEFYEFVEKLEELNLPARAPLCREIALAVEQVNNTLDTRAMETVRRLRYIIQTARKQDRLSREELDLVAQNEVEVLAAERYNMPSLETLDTLFRFSRPLLMSAARDLRSLSAKVRHFEALLLWVSSGYVDGPLRFLASKRDKVDVKHHGTETVKKWYPVYEKFLLDYSEWAKRLNAAAGYMMSWHGTYVPPAVRPDSL